jgi:hypothetical protein
MAYSLFRSIRWSLYVTCHFKTSANSSSRFTYIYLTFSFQKENFIQRSITFEK